MFTLHTVFGYVEFSWTYFLSRCCWSLVFYVYDTPFSLPSCTHSARHPVSAPVWSGASEKQAKTL